MNWLITCVYQQNFLAPSDSLFLSDHHWLLALALWVQCLAWGQSQMDKPLIPSSCRHFRPTAIQCRIANESHRTWAQGMPADTKPPKGVAHSHHYQRDFWGSNDCTKGILQTEVELVWVCASQEQKWIFLLDVFGEESLGMSCSDSKDQSKDRSSSMHRQLYRTEMGVVSCPHLSRP